MGRELRGVQVDNKPNGVVKSNGVVEKKSSPPASKSPGANGIANGDSPPFPTKDSEVTTILK